MKRSLLSMENVRVLKKRTALRLLKLKQPSRRSTKHIIRRQGPPDPLQLELTDRLDRHGVLNLRQHPRTNQDLPWLRFIAQTRGDVGNGADSGIVKAALKADSAKRGEAVRYADAEANACPHRRHVSVNAPMASRISSAINTA